MVKRILRKYGYPPDKQEQATDTVLQQAELLCADVVGPAADWQKRRLASPQKRR